MTRPLPRTNFNSSRLIRFLADLSVVDAAESKQAFAERLGEWLDFSDAITLHAAQGVASPPAAPSDGRSGASIAAQEEFARVRTALVTSITASCSLNPGESRIRWPTPIAGAVLEIVVAYEPYRRFYAAHQGDMESAIRPLRVTVRKALAQACPALRQLAALDLALDNVLCVRERQLLSTVPALLEKRFEQLRKAPQLPPVDLRRADDADLSIPSNAWLAGLRKEFQGALLAELDLRLQPTLGLIEAFSNEAE